MLTIHDLKDGIWTYSNGKYYTKMAIFEDGHIRCPKCRNRMRYTEPFKESPTIWVGREAFNGLAGFVYKHVECDTLVVMMK
jgi:hypothetical protein